MGKEKTEEGLTATIEDLVEKASQLIKEGNVRKLMVRHKEKVIIEIPLTAGVVGAFLAPQLAALAIFSGLLTGCTITIEGTKQ